MNREDQTSNSKEWYVWSVRPGKFEIVCRYIQDKIPEVNQILNPVSKDKRATKKEKNKSLYGGYIFLQYKHSATVWHKISKHPFIITYVGPCQDKELASVVSLQKNEECSKEEVKDFSAGDTIIVIDGIYKGFSGVVTDTIEEAVKVSLKMDGVKNSLVFNPRDLNRKK